MHNMATANINLRCYYSGVFLPVTDLSSLISAIDKGLIRAPKKALGAIGYIKDEAPGDVQFWSWGKQDQEAGQPSTQDKAADIAIYNKRVILSWPGMNQEGLKLIREALRPRNNANETSTEYTARRRKALSSLRRLDGQGDLTPTPPTPPAPKKRTPAPKKTAPAPAPAPAAGDVQIPNWMSDADEGTLRVIADSGSPTAAAAEAELARRNPPAPAVSITLTRADLAALLGGEELTVDGATVALCL